MLTVNAVLYTVSFVLIALGVRSIWRPAPLAQRVHAVAVLLNSLTFIAGAWSRNAPFFEGRSPRLVGWSIGLSITLVAVALVAHFQRSAARWYQPRRSAILAAIPLAALATLVLSLAW
ncbi:MAG: hypothetical protein ACT4R6_09955 [Gemmatimonadaceae bacterium]